MKIYFPHSFTQSIISRVINCHNVTAIDWSSSGKGHRRRTVLQPQETKRQTRWRQAIIQATRTYTKCAEHHYNSRIVHYDENTTLNEWQWMNIWMNFITNIPPMKPEGQAPGCILRRSMVFNPLGDDSPIMIWAIIPLLVEWKLDVF